MLTLQLNEGGSQESESAETALTPDRLEDRRLLTATCRVLGLVEIGAAVLLAGRVEAGHRLLLELELVLGVGELLVLGGLAGRLVLALAGSLLPSPRARQFVEVVVGGGDRLVLHLSVAKEEGVLGDVLLSDAVEVVKLLLQPAGVPLVVGVGELLAFALALAGVAGSLGGVPGAALGDGSIGLEVLCSVDDLAEASTRESTLGDGGELHERAETAIGRANILAVTVAVADAAHSPGQVVEDGDCLDAALELGLPGVGGLAGVLVGSVVVALQLGPEDPGEAPAAGPVEEGEGVVHVGGPALDVDLPQLALAGEVVVAGASASLVGLAVAASEACGSLLGSVVGGDAEHAVVRGGVDVVGVELGLLESLDDGGVLEDLGLLLGAGADVADHGGEGVKE